MAYHCDEFTESYVHGGMIAQVIFLLTIFSFLLICEEYPTQETLSTMPKVDPKVARDMPKNSSGPQQPKRELSMGRTGERINN